MGSFSQKTTNVSTPSPQQTAAGNTLNTVFQQQLPRINAYADQIGGLIPSLMAQQQQGNPGVNAAQDWITRTLSQPGENPNLQAMIDQSGNDMARGINANLGTRGNVGGSVQQRILASELGKQSLGLRYNDFNAQMQRQAQAAGMAPGNAAAGMIPISSLLAAANYAGGAPLNATSQYASGMGGLFGNTGTSTTTQSPNFGQMLLSGLSNAAMAVSDARLKQDIRKVGQTDGGLPVYTFRYKGEPQIYMGVMAQDVAQSQPEALGPLIDGEYMTVNYEEVR